MSPTVIHVLWETDERGPAELVAVFASQQVASEEMARRINARTLAGREWPKYGITTHEVGP